MAGNAICHIRTLGDGLSGVQSLGLFLFHVRMTGKTGFKPVGRALLLEDPVHGRVFGRVYALVTGGAAKIRMRGFCKARIVHNPGRSCISRAGKKQNDQTKGGHGCHSGLAEDGISLLSHMISTACGIW